MFCRPSFLSSADWHRSDKTFYWKLMCSELMTSLQHGTFIVTWCSDLSLVQIFQLKVHITVLSTSYRYMLLQNCFYFKLQIWYNFVFNSFVFLSKKIFFHLREVLKCMVPNVTIAPALRETGFWIGRVSSDLNTQLV